MECPTPSSSAAKIASFMYWYPTCGSCDPQLGLLPFLQNSSLTISAKTARLGAITLRLGKRERQAIIIICVSVGNEGIKLFNWCCWISHFSDFFFFFRPTYLRPCNLIFSSSVSLQMPYFMYPVHVSISFLITPTLSAALYLLLLRFLHRQYSEVAQLSNSISTDAEFTQEERQVGVLNNNCGFCKL